MDANDKMRFLSYYQAGTSTILGVNWAGAPDAGAAAEAVRKELQEIVDFLDFHSPTQNFELAPLCFVTWNDNDGNAFSRIHPDTSGEQPPHADHTVEIDSDWSEQLVGLAEALRWSSVARRERTPEVSLLAAWFAFEFLAGTLERTPVEGIMEFFPRVLALGNLKRRLIYWVRSLQASPGYEGNSRHDALAQRVSFQRGGLNVEGTIELLGECMSAAPTDDGRAIQEIVLKSVLLRERTAAEAKLFSNNQLLAQTLQEDSKQVQRELQGFLVMRNKLVHRARIDHPLLPIVAERARDRLYDLLRDISSQLTTQRLRNSVGEVLQDYRDTFDELLSDLGQNRVNVKSLANRITLS